MERDERQVSEIDGSVDLDRVRRAFGLTKAQARMLATLFVPNIQKVLLPELKGTRQAVLKKRRDLDTAAESIDNATRAVGAMEEMNIAIMFFRT